MLFIFIILFFFSGIKSVKCCVFDILKVADSNLINIFIAGNLQEWKTERKLSSKALMIDLQDNAFFLFNCLFKIRFQSVPSMCQNVVFSSST